ncbi:MAG: hypothetical protein IJ647_08325, partial [Prevotella sp.]|nr:hypothetical protein [Prevotella sp.]
ATGAISTLKAMSHGKRCLEWKQGSLTSKAAKPSGVFVTRKLPCSTLQGVAWRGIRSRWSLILQSGYWRKTTMTAK